jgi:hydroxymethylbilane synthase
VRQIVLGTRGSDLARAQTSLVEKALKEAGPEIEVVVKIITTHGDEKGGASFQLAGSEKEQVENLRYGGRKGLFTAEIERALLDREIDVAVHSAKDLPSEKTPGLEICAALPRAPVEDVLVGDLPPGATVATGSVRRQHQLRWLHPEVKLVDLRGNVPTRLRKLTTNPWDAIILARAGLERLGFDCGAGEIEFEGQKLHVAILPTDKFLPAGGQGIVALQVRSDDVDTGRFVSAVNDRETLLCLRAEREFLRLLQGNCGTPVGVLATIESDQMTLRAQIFEAMGTEPKAGASTKNPMSRTPELAAELLFNFLHATKN